MPFHNPQLPCYWKVSGSDMSCVSFLLVIFAFFQHLPLNWKGWSSPLPYAVPFEGLLGEPSGVLCWHLLVVTSLFLGCGRGCSEL